MLVTQNSAVVFIDCVACYFSAFQCRIQMSFVGGCKCTPMIEDGMRLFCHALVFVLLLPTLGIAAGIQREASKMPCMIGKTPNITAKKY